MNSVTELLGEVSKIDASIDAFMSTADLDNIEHLDAVLAMLERAERLLLRVEGLAGHGGADIAVVQDIRRAILGFLDAEIAISDHRAVLAARMHAALAEAERSTKH